jgi:hypothetical protein
MTGPGRESRKSILITSLAIQMVRFHNFGSRSNFFLRLTKSGFFDAWKGGYADKSKEEAVEPEYESEIHFAEPKLKAKMLEDDGTTWRERQGIFLYKYFNLKDGTLDYKGPIKPPPPP